MCSIMLDRGNRLAKIKEKIFKKAPYVSTGSTLLDLSLGGGDAIDKGGMGEKVGNILNVAGDSGSGKSFLVCEIIANARKDVLSGKLAEHGITKFKWVYNDVESGYNFDSMALWGFEIQPEEKSDRFSTRTIERCSSHIQDTLQKLKEDELLVYVIDSWDALGSEAEVKRNAERVAKHKKDGDYDKGTYGMDKNKFIGGSFFNPIQTLMMEKNCILILVSQLRANVGASMFEKKWRIGGEGVMRYFCDTRVMIKTADTYEENTIVPETGEEVTRWMGSSVVATPLKTRHSRPCRDVQYEFLFEYGLDDVPSCVDFLYNLREAKTKKIRTGDAVKNLSFPQKPPGQAYTSRIMPNLRSWVKEQLPDGGVKSTTSKDVLMEMVSTNNLTKEFEAEFGSGLDRQGLINYIFDNDLEEELRKAVIARWEYIENSVSSVLSKRKRKW